MLVLAGILLQDPVTFEVGMGPWCDEFVGLGSQQEGFMRNPTAADIVGFLIDSAFMTGKASIELFNLACCWQGVWRYQELAQFLRNKLIREKYGLVTADVAFAVAHVPPPYYSPFHIHLTNLAYTDLKIKLFLAIKNNPLHPGIGIRLYDLTTGKPSTYLHRFSRADVLRVRELIGARDWNSGSSAALRALSATGRFQILVAEAGRISGVELLDGLRHEASHALSVPSCMCLGEVFCGFWSGVGRYNSTLMIGTQVQYCSFDGAKVLLDKSEDFCDADAIAAARVARDAALTDLTHLQRAKLAAEDRVLDVWPRPVPEELRRAADAARKAAAAKAKAFAAARKAAAVAEKAAAAATKACSAAAKKAAVAATKAAAAATQAAEAAAKEEADAAKVAELRAAYQREQAAAPRPVAPPAPASPVAEESDEEADGPTLGDMKRKAAAKKGAKKAAKKAAKKRKFDEELAAALQAEEEEDY